MFSFVLSLSVIVTVVATSAVPVTFPVSGPAKASEVTVPSKNAFLHSLDAEPKSYVFVAFGTICEVNSPAKDISSESASPMVILPPKTKFPEMSTLALMSTVVALISTSVSEVMLRTPSALCLICVPESPNCNCLDEFSNKPVSAT